MKTSKAEAMIKEMRSAVERASERLAASKVECEAETRERGRDAGIEWAADQASYRELERLAAAEINFYGCDHRGPAATFADVVFGLDRMEEDELWESYLGRDLSDVDDLCSADFWDAFVDGALEVYFKAGV
jgi:hypothetical protein